ncbi:MAG: GFA family protein [Novosphingobium sp.]
MSEHLGSCHCGAVRLVLREDPVEATSCNCSICRRIGGMWHYSDPANITVEGQGTAYRQGDCMLDTWHCGTCGCTTHWTPVDPAYQRIAVNLRMFDPELWQDLPLRHVDGASF